MKVGPCEIFCGDCFGILKNMPNESVDAIVTDPPFGIGFKYLEKEEHDDPVKYFKWFKL